MGRTGGERTIFSLNTAIQAVGEGNYGRRRRRAATRANSAPMFEPDEMPGALPEILPSPDFGDSEDNDRNIDRCWTCRAMFVQAWGHYGTAWPVVHQQLGVRPSLGTGALEVVPQLPPGQTRAEGRSIRLGKGAVDVRAERAGRRYVTTVRTDDLRLARPAVGATLPHGTRSARSRWTGGASGDRACAGPTAASRSPCRPRRTGATRWWSPQASLARLDPHQIVGSQGPTRRRR